MTRGTLFEWLKTPYQNAWFLLKVCLAYFLAVLDPLAVTPAGQWAEWVLTQFSFGRGRLHGINWLTAGIALLTIGAAGGWLLLSLTSCNPYVHLGA